MLGTNYDKHTYIHKTNKTNKRNWLLSLLILLLFFFFTLKLKLCITHKRECLLSVMFKLLINGSDRMNFSRANNRYFCGTSAQSTEPFLVWWRKTQYFHKNVRGYETINLWAVIIFAFKAILDQTTMSKVPPFWIATHTHTHWIWTLCSFSTKNLYDCMDSDHLPSSESEKKNIHCWHLFLQRNRFCSNYSCSTRRRSIQLLILLITSIFHSAIYVDRK